MVIVGLFGVVIGVVIGGPGVVLVVVLVVWLVGGLGVVLGGVDGLRPADTMRFSWARMRSGLSVGLSVGPGVGLSVVWLVGGLVFGLDVVLVIGLSGGLGGWLVIGLNNALVTGEIATRSGANEGTRRSLLQWARTVLLFGLVFGLVFGLGGGLGGGLFGRLFGGLVFGLFGGLARGMHKGGGFFIQHWVLRLLLWRKGFAPLRYVRFLDYATDRVFLRKIGGGYIFIHRMLMEHFAKLRETETEAASDARSAAA